MKFAKRIASVILAGGIAFGATACDAISLESPLSNSGGSASAAQGFVYDKVDVDASLAQLNTIAVKGRAPKTGYDREGQFGSPWKDVDENHCDTRNDILGRDLINKTYNDDCEVATGVLNDKYTGKVINFVRGKKTSSEVQIDHLIPLSDAYQKGAQQWPQEKRVAFANDPINLMASDGPSNGSKSDSDLATWLPPNRAFWCEYTAKIVNVKATYGVWMTQAEHDKAAEILSTCK